jgi:uncharacterized membrane protein
VTSRLDWLRAQITSRFWFRVSLYGLLAVVAALLATWVAPIVPEALTERIAEGTARGILEILASSMLVVATFSLGTMVQAFGAAASLATPRATRVLIDDPFSQRVLSTFLGAFVFSIVGLFAQSFGYYSHAGEAVMLLAAGVVITLVITTLFGWLDHLANMIRLGDIIAKVENRAERVLRDRAASPRMGGVAPDDAPPLNWTIAANEADYVRHLDMAALQEIAEAAGGIIEVECPPGAMTDIIRPLARTSWEASEDDADAIRDAFTTGRERSLEEDPRYCLQVMAEIGSRALSPGVNDPGTAIAIVAAQQRLLTAWARERARHDPADIAFDRVIAPGLTPDDLFEDAFAPLLRDAAPNVEVGLRLQRSFNALARLGHPGYADAAAKSSGKALRHAARALALSEDHDRLTGAAEGLAPETAA